MSLGSFRRRPVHRGWVIGITTTAVAALIVFYVASASAVLPGSPSKFEAGNDPTLGLGNMIVDNHPVPGDPACTGPPPLPALFCAPAPHTDWISVTGDPAYVHLQDVASSGTDDSFTPGQKQDTTCPTIDGHGNPPKDDFTDVASFTEVASGGTFDGDTYLYGATMRYAANGNASENIELKQGTSGLCSGSTTLLARTPGDKMIAIDYLGGGKAVQLHVLTWVASAPCFVSKDPAPCWGASVLTLDPAFAEGGVNPAAIAVGDNPISGKALVAGQFAEFGVNLAGAGIIPPGSCKSFSQTVWESRSSGSSFVSSTKDITIEDKDINNCPSVSVIKLGSDGGSQAGAVFTLYEGTGTGGTVVGTCTVLADTTCSDPSFTGLQPGTYTIDETSGVAGYGKDPLLPHTFTLAAGDALVLTFTDPALTGAITITKTAKHAGPNGSANLVAGFTVTDSTSGTHAVSTDADGHGCVDGIPQGAATVSETGPPAGYHPGPDVPVTVVAGTTCADANGVNASFANIPLTNITISVDSQVVGGTSSTIDCDGVLGSTDGNGDGSVARTDLEPGEYHCTVVVDP
jgi:hypothetical protein